MTSLRTFGLIGLLGLSLTGCGGDDDPAPPPPAPPPPNAAPLASAVTIIDTNGGDAVVGDMLSATYAYSDADGDAEGASTYQWLRDGTPIAGATSQAYQVVTADSSTTLALRVTPVAASGASPGVAATSSGLAIVNSVPIASNVAIVDGNGGAAQVGETLTGAYQFSDVDGDAEGASAFRWLRDGASIAGATAITYTPVAADVGAQVTFEVSPVAATGSPQGMAVVSMAVTVTQVNTPPTAGEVAIDAGDDGEGRLGETLAGLYTYGDDDGDAEGASQYRWLRDGLPIDGANATTYTVTLVDVGTLLRFEVTPVAASGASPGTPAQSTSIDVRNSPPQALDVRILDEDGGDALVGDTLEGLYTYEDAEDDAQGNTTYRWLRDGSGIGGATDTRYTLTEADVDSEIVFEVVPRAATGTQFGTATESDPIVASPAPPRVLSLARYLDLDLSGDVNAGDAVVIPFDRDIVVNDATSADLVLPVVGDGFGSGATLARLGTDQLMVTLGSGAAITVDGDFSPAALMPASPSGVDVAMAPAPDAIENEAGIDAIAATPLDITVGFVDGGARFLESGTRSADEVLLGDLDGDGDQDIAVAIRNVSSVFLNDGSGTFGDRQGDLGDGRDLALGDIDGDGDLDIIVAGRDGVQVNANDGSGGFTSVQTFLGGTDCTGAGLGDLDGDGDLDLVVSAVNSPDYVFFNDGTGLFMDSTQRLVDDSDTFGVGLGDLDGDGDVDLLQCVDANGDSSPQPRIFLNDGTGLFTAGQELGRQRSATCALADLDGDGRLDIVIGIFNDDNRVYLNDGTGTFSNAGQSLRTGGASVTEGLAIADVDGDGDNDVMVADGGDGLALWINDGNAMFRDSYQRLSGGNHAAVALGDVDGDGDPDAVAALVNDDGIVYLNSRPGGVGNDPL